jgi:peptidoglycan LD-endopeptidase LytH
MAVSPAGKSLVSLSALPRATRSASAARRRSVRRTVSLGVAGALLAAGATGAATGPASAQTSQEVRGQLEALSQQVNEAETREAEAGDRARALEEQADATAARLEDLRDRLKVRARAAYTNGLGGSEPLMALFTSDRPTDALDRISMVSAASGHDGGLLDETLVEEERLVREQAEAAEALEQARLAKADLERSAAEVSALLQRVVAEEEAAARARAEALAAEQARASRDAAAARAAAPAPGPAAAPAPTSSGPAATGVTAANGRACPVGSNHSFIDSWGFARSGGRAHKGTDIMAPYGAPAYAIVSGTVTRTGNNGLGGIVLYLRGDNGDTYYYAHNAQNLVASGQRVSAGQEIAKVGATGNAAGGAPHIHFEVHPGGGSAVNPYPLLRGLCG